MTVGSPQPPPFPEGWYAVALSAEVEPGSVHILQLAGEELVLFRTASGKLGLLEAYCPHLGAHLGHGGTVEEETLRCPFHGFRFDADGRCVSTPYGRPPPPAARTRAPSVEERHGLVLAYHHPMGHPPDWRVGELEIEGWSPLRTASWEIRGHPQETTENSVDLGHFTEVHGYDEVESLAPLETDGPHLRARYALTRPDGLFGRPVRAELDIRVDGLGYSLVAVRVPEYDLETRLFVLATPTRGETIILRGGLSLRRDLDPRRLHPLLGLLPRSLLRAAIGRAAFRSFCRDLQQDFEIWRHKRYLQPAALADGDGPVGRYRQWAKQFYPTAQPSTVGK